MQNASDAGLLTYLGSATAQEKGILNAVYDAHMISGYDDNTWRKCVENSYVFITSLNGSSGSTSEATGIFLDGQLDRIQVSVDGIDPSPTVNAWFTYTVDGSVYTLTQVPVSDATSAIDASKDVYVAQYAELTYQGAIDQLLDWFL